MKVSFLVPVYNTEKYLTQCLDSLLCQRGCDFEIILLDDGSTDHSGLICDQYEKKNPSVIKVIHKENEGLLLTRRLGFQVAQGDWLICVDSDDYVSKDLLQTVCSIIRESDCDMVMYNFVKIYDSGREEPSGICLNPNTIYKGEEKQIIYQQRLIKDTLNNMWQKALKRDIIDLEFDYHTIGIRNMCEDAVQSLPLLTNAHKIVYTDRILYYYRKGQESITADYSMERWMASFECAKMTAQYMKKWGVSHSIEARTIAREHALYINFVRWKFQIDKSSIRYTIEELASDERFLFLYKNNHKKSYATRYLEFSVPLLSKYIIYRHYILIQIYFWMETALLGIVRRGKITNVF